MDNIIQKLKKENLLGRSGSGFPVGLKWEMVKNAKPESPFLKKKKKYIICNASEGEPGVFKDKYILENFPEEVIEGIKIALKTIDHSSAFIFLNKKYYRKISPILQKLIGRSGIKIIKKKSSKYIAGEETAILEVIEGKRPEPRIKPPYPTQSGLFGFPTLINNVETFYYIAKISKNEYRSTKFFCLSGDIKNKGVFELSENWTIKKILEETKNWPKHNFFVQAGGGACGEILLPKELNKQLMGIGSIIVFNRKTTNIVKLMKKWSDFLILGNCDKCVPCREGSFRIKEILSSKKIDKETLKEILYSMEETSFCPLGKGSVIPFKGIISKIMK